ncbi:hypothetical protein F8M41_019335 [Gigaspora margarita]|uniref:Uncharacterized protein n=1 Tax=Gigaspora margarita TaxID=4874 RepID=A0A8H4AK49_GIGMA|nr:hypothetical protein F8M41_019335 [Gigaspora margarita]
MNGIEKNSRCKAYLRSSREYEPGNVEDNKTNKVDDDGTNELKRNGLGAKTGNVYDLKDTNEIVSSETSNENNDGSLFEEDSKQLNDEFEKVLENENLDRACEVWTKKFGEF